MTNSNLRRTALVLAGSRGLGFASAARLASQGMAVGVCSRSADDVEAAADKLNTSSPSVGTVADVSDPQAVHEAARMVRQKLGPISVLVANAAGPRAGGFDDMSADDWDNAYRLSLMSVVESIEAVLPDMRSLGGGRIIVIGSSSIRRPITNLTLSNTFRPAINGLVKDLAVTYAPDGVTVNMVAPGRIDTDRVRSLDAIASERQGRPVDEVRADSERSIPMGRYGRADEFGAMVGFLASEDAAYITGQSILVDGGMTASLP